MNLAQQNDYQKEISQLRQRNEYLEEENLLLKNRRVHEKSRAPIVRVTLPGIRLARTEENILYCLSLQDFITKDHLWDFLYGNRPLDKQPYPKIIDIYLTRLRGKLKSLGVEIVTVRGRGYSMNEPGREIIKAHSERYDKVSDAEPTGAKS